MEELDDWKNQMILDDYNKLLDFITNTKNKQKTINKFLLIVGNIQKAIKLIIDIENEIGVDECDYVEYSNLEKIFVPNQDKYILQPDNLDIKCLTVEIDNIEYFECNTGIIKEIIRDNKILNFNTIMITNELPNDLSILHLFR